MNASFTISGTSSTRGPFTVSGTKSGPASLPLPGQFSVCTPSGLLQFYESGVPLLYTATIHLASRDLSDRGMSLAGPIAKISDCSSVPYGPPGSPLCPPDSFTEGFTSFGRGFFVIGDENATLGSTVNFWGSQWSFNNSLSGGPAPASFKGFAENPPASLCGASYTTNAGNSSLPPASVSSPLLLLVSSNITQTGATISGDIRGAVVITPNPGYFPAVGHPGTGTVTLVFSCPN